MDITTLRTALIITLTILVVYLAFKKFRAYVRKRDLPVLQHAELIELEVVYHPARLRVLVHVPGPHQLELAVLNAQHSAVHRWEPVVLVPGRHALDLELPKLVDGTYYVELRTTTQRTERLFRLQQA